MRVAVAAACLIAGCGASDATPVTIRSQSLYLTPEGPVTASDDLSQLQFAVYVANGDSGFDRYPNRTLVLGTTQGLATIDDVPSGPYLLQITQPGSVRWEAHTDHAIEWSSTWIGRRDAVSATTIAPVYLQGVQISPWGVSDEIIADCWSNGTEVDQVQADLAPPPTTDATTLTGRFDSDGPYAQSFSAAQRPALLDPTAGDTLVLSRLASSPVGVVEIGTLAEVLTTSDISQVNGSLATVTGGFTAVPTSATFFPMPDLYAFTQSLAPTSNTIGWSSALYAGPGTSQGVLMGPPLVTIDGQLEPPTSGAMYGDPFDPTWPIVRQTYFYAEGTEGGGESYVWERVPIDGAADAIEPRAHLINTLTFNGVQGSYAWDGMSPLTIAVDSDIDGFVATFQQAQETDFVPANQATSVATTGSSVTLPPIAIDNNMDYEVTISVGIDDGSNAAHGSYTQMAPIHLGD